MSAAVDKVIQALYQAGYNPQQSGDRWNARCPAHDDHKPSLSVSIGNDNRVLLRCFAGCRVDDIVQKLGLTVADLFEEKKVSKSSPSIEAVYPYCNTAGNVVFEVVRYFPKNFRQRVPKADGSYQWNLTGLLPEEKELPYRLPELQKAVDDDQSCFVYIVEGEKDVDALRKHGFVATCNAGGANKWTENHTAHLVKAGVKLVYIIADRDDTGKKHARAVAKSLSDNGISVSACVPSCKDNCKDVTDILSQHGEGIGNCVMPLPTGTEDKETKPEAKPRKIVSCSPDEIPDEKPDWLLRGWLVKGALHMIAGRPGVGKSTAVGAIVAALTNGKDPMGNPIPAVRCGWLSWEEDRTVIGSRLKAAGVLSENMRLWKTPLGQMEIPDNLDNIRTQITEDELDLLVLDGIGYGVDQESYQRLGAQLAHLGEMAATTGCALLGIAHTPKSAKSSEAPVIGSTSWTSVSRIVAVVGDAGDATKRVLAIAKSNYKWAESLAFDLDEDKEREVAVAVGWQRSNMKAGDLLAEPAERLERSEVERAIREYLEDDPMLTLAEIKKRLEADGLNPSDRTLTRALKNMEVERKRNGFGGNVTYSLKSSKSSNLATLSPDGEYGNIGGNGSLSTEESEEALLLLREVWQPE